MNAETKRPMAVVRMEPLMVFLLLPMLLSAQNYAVDWDVFSPGGGTSAGSTYSMSDTVGQPLVGASTVGDYSLEDGFWPGMNTAPITAQDTLVRITNRTAKILLTSILANDSDPDADSVQITAIGGLSTHGGSVSVEEGWAFYVPPAGLNESDSFTYTLTDAEGNQAVGSVAIQMAGASGAQPRTIVSLLPLPDGTRQIRFVGIAGRTYSIQATTDLASPVWQELATRPADANGLFDYLDTELPAPPQRFYRAVTY
jgi:hypothetical protein